MSDMKDKPQRAIREDEPLMIAWNAHKATPEYANTKRWALDLNFLCKNGEMAVDGNQWAAFMAGWKAAGGKIEP